MTLAMALPIAAVEDVATASPPTRTSLPPVTAPPAALVSTLHLSPLYAKYTDAGGVPVLGSRTVNEYALREASWIIRQMVGHRPDILRAIAGKGIRVVVMATTEMTTDVPEHSDLTPKAYWDRRARGVGATTARPATSCAEENLLELPGDPYAAENILVHEFGHTVHEQGMSTVDPTFDGRLAAAYAHAKSGGLWAGTYAMTNRSEYWAEATQSWFDTNRANDSEHGPIDTRAKLVGYDREVAALLREVYGDGSWRYTRPSARAAADRAHLDGFDLRTAGRFSWPAATPSASVAPGLLPWLAPGQLPSASPSSSQPTNILFANHRQGEVVIDWIDMQGTRKRYFTLLPGASLVQSTYVGHAWSVSDDRGLVVGGVVATANGSRIDIR